MTDKKVNKTTVILTPETQRKIAEDHARIDREQNNIMQQQNEQLIKLMEDKKNKTLLDKFKDLFKYK